METSIPVQSPEPALENETQSALPLAFSIAIPIHNEAAILDSVVRGILTELADVAENYEIILYENGSSDDTLAIARRLAAENPRVIVHTSPQASYGMAVKEGILRSSGDRVIVFNADLLDIPFLLESCRLLDNYDIVIASKRHPGSRDQRPWNRRFITWSFNLVLRLLFNFRGTDTHGMKAFRRAPIVPVIRECVTDREIFDTEVILRGQRAGLRIIEVPTVVEETRPSRYGMFSRVPRTLRDLRTLRRALNARL